jgi:hypothetical protein
LRCGGFGYNLRIDPAEDGLANINAIVKELKSEAASIDSDVFYQSLSDFASHPYILMDSTLEEMIETTVIPSGGKMQMLPNGMSVAAHVGSDIEVSIPSLKISLLSIYMILVINNLKRFFAFIARRCIYTVKYLGSLLNPLKHSPPPLQ